MKLSLVSLLFAVVSVNAKGDNEKCLDCDCFKCVRGSVKTITDGYEGFIGYKQVTVSHCKKGAISWMCCTGSDSPGGGACGIADCTNLVLDSKCNNVARGLNVVASCGTTTFNPIKGAGRAVKLPAR